MSVLSLVLQVALADSPLTARQSQTGNLQGFFVGTPLAEDGDGDGRVDALDQPATFTVPALPADVGVELAVLYWSTSVAQGGAACTSSPDQDVTFTPPGGAPTGVSASSCVCSDALDPGYDLWTCSAEVNGLVESGTVDGGYVIEDVAAFISNDDGHGASATMALWVSHPSFPTRRLELRDGLVTVDGSQLDTSFSGFDAAGVGVGGAELHVYALDGDVGVSPGEQINLEGLPSGSAIGLVDAVNPFNDAFNSTITSGTPLRADTYGIDLDAWDVSAALSVGDDTLAVEIGGGADAFFVAAQQLSVETRDPNLGASSTLGWTLLDDADGNGVVSNGDTVRFTALLSNSGAEAATFDLIDGMPTWAASWSVVDAGTGIEDSFGSTLQIIDLELGPLESTSVQFDLEIGFPPDGTSHVDIATYTAPLQGGSGGQLVAPAMLIRVDTDGDGVFDEDDACPGGSDTTDADGDGIPDGCDTCLGDDRLDADGDGAPDACDVCPGEDDTLDADGDSNPDGCDVCPGADDFADEDGDSVPDGCDVCVDFDDRVDADNDTVPDGCDICPVADDRLDIDGDGAPDACDRCPGEDDALDTDGDGTPDGCDVCPGGDDSGDADGDTVPDACDVCDGSDDRIDTDFDGIPDGCDTCAGDLGAADSDGDTVADICDVCDGADDRIDTDGDGIPNGCDNCEGDPTDSDLDSVPDECDLCPFFDDRLDGDADGYPDGCDRCLAGDDRDDADGDGTPDACDLCPGADDSGDADLDGVPDGCDVCDNADDALDADGDLVPDGCDACPDFDDAADADGDGVPDACDNCPGRPNEGQLDLDMDGIGDICDPCPEDAGEEDLDGDGTPACLDCNDGDPTLNLVDADGDGVGTCDGDCYDDDPTFYPGNLETADGRDEDCDGVVDEGTVRGDDDGDGFTELGGDCDDGDPTIHPGAVEVCNGQDDDCDVDIDEGTPCFDDDGDGFCEQGCANEGDCDDSNIDIHPSQVEVPGNGVDDDCNGRVDDTSLDADGDGYSVLGGDCADDKPDVHPGAVETPNGEDDDCDGVVDEGTTLFDDDGDGFSEGAGDCHDGDPLTSPVATEIEDGVDNDCDGIVDNGTEGVDDDGDGFAERAGDCDDANVEIYPGAPEAEDGVDNDCDAAVDEDFVDVDQDGWSFADGDCNDQNGWVNPGIGEFCDQIDNDCDGEVDEDGVCFRSARDVPVATGAPSSSCSTGPTGVFWLAPLLALLVRRRSWLALPALAAGCTGEIGVNPTLSRVLVGPAMLDMGEAGLGEAVRGNIQIDHIDGTAVEVRGVLVTNFAGDHFRYIGPETLIVGRGETVNLPIEFLPVGEGWHTASVEVLHEGETSPDQVALRGRAVPPRARVSPQGVDFGRVDLGQDRVLEVRIDNESDVALGLTDVSTNNPRFSVDFVTPIEVRPDSSHVFAVTFLPAGADPTQGELTFMAGETVVGRVALWGNACDQGLVEAYDADDDGHSVCADDCDDSSASIYPGAPEVEDGIDQDCDGVVDEGTPAFDDDGDGYCENPAFCIDGALPGDCNDQDTAVNPGVLETLGNGIDDDCDGTVDVDVVDVDGDGYAESGGDCDDANPTRNPGHPEIPDGLDNDCDGDIDEGTERSDDDGDGWCEADVCVVGVLPGDCDDIDPDTYPNAVELEDWKDNDCDTLIDEGTANADDDGDGFTENGGDCDDADPLVSPVLGGCP